MSSDRLTPPDPDRDLQAYARNRIESWEDPNEALTVGIYWTGSCGGCDATFVDLGETLLDLGEYIDIAIWPLATDFKRADLEALPEDGMDVCLFNGAIREDEHEAIAELVRDRSEVLVAFGACAQLGGIPGLSDFEGAEHVTDTKYGDDRIAGGEPPRAETVVDSGTLSLPTLREHVDRLADVVDVEYTVPGCPPSKRWTVEFLLSAIEGDLPPPGTIIAGDDHVCRECSRTIEERDLAALDRVHETVPDEDCLLDQGVVCLGPLTRAGCGARCPDVNVPCRGCYGVAESTGDVGAQLASSLGSLIEPREADAVADLVADQPDWAGLTHYFSLPDSSLRAFVRSDRNA
ncbi:MAG: NADH:ubiquinone oxidoreductase [Halococcoides sp.]